MKKPILTAAILAGISSAAFASAFTSGDIVVYETESSSTLSSAATAVDLSEFSTTGSLVESLAMPTADSGTTHSLTDSGSAGSDGLLTLSPNGEYLTLAGYDASVGTTGVVSGGGNVTIGIVDGNGDINTSTSLSGLGTNNTRSAITTDGTSIWLAGSVSGNGVDYTTVGSTTATELSGSNSEEVQIFDNQLYVSSEKSFQIATLGSGLPTSGLQTETGLSGFGKATGDFYQFFMTNLGGGSAPDTLYVADSSSGIEKWSLEAGVWKETGDIAFSGATGLTGTDDDGTVELFVTSSSKLDSLTDTSGFEGTLDGSLDNLVTLSGGDDQFKGVAFAPTVAAVPEPSTWAGLLCGVVGLAGLRFRRGRKA
ncbi:MAG TPA: PEP-CTERM sorting domain-containing protein [Chthoniobacteraceae bacterium]|jgi:hypothetical protein|nr:PEP-CTERM sorting domain-containing protein [Chthoniobacteraceae bacterium]